MQADCRKTVRAGRGGRRPARRGAALRDGACDRSGCKSSRQRETVQTEIDRRRQVLAEANREVRVLENLRDKQAGQHRQQEERREMKRLDEVAQQQALREVAQ